MSRVYTRNPLAERFDAFVDKSGDCWIWTGARGTHGYGVINVGNHRCKTAHRLAWQFAYGDIPAGFHVCHSCDNRPCVRPTHLFLGTDADNLRDMREKGRGSPPPPQIGPANVNAKLSTEQVAELREMRRAGVPVLQVANYFGVHKDTVSKITNWRSRKIA